jgi:DMSO/TMAO reductase YedYZ molybdopterin-dependent catalytic subunit
MQDPNVIISSDTKRTERVPAGQRLTDKWPVLHYGSVPFINTSAWTLKIFGLVDKVKTLDFQEFSALPTVKVFSDIHCVTTWSKLDNLWEGVSTAVIKDLVKIDPKAKYVMIHGAPNFTTNLSLADFFEPDVLLAVKHDDKVLSADHGGPVRLVVPKLYFWKSAKWVTGIEFMEEDKAGFWESNGYHIHGDPWKEERYGR